ncbi:MAG TPA: ADOP family duplicated permease [Candidatus Angelobacter sp.]|nr:ADOP family duplicated permease [Candidatus Angelobacter sp.]
MFSIFYEWLEGLARDLRYGARNLRRKPGVLVVSALSLGLGIGVNTILYMGISNIYGHKPTMHDPKRVMGVELGNGNQFSYPDYQDLLRSGIFSGALGFRTTTLNLGPKGEVTRVGATVVTGNYFEVLGISAAVGRMFSGIDAQPETEPRVVVVTSGFWRAYLRGDYAAIGEPIVLNGERFTVVGILPDNYQAVTGWRDRGVYVPLSKLILPSIDQRDTPSLTVLARLQPNTSAGQAAKAVTSLNEWLQSKYPARLSSRGRPASIFPAEDLQFRGAPAQLLLMKIAWGTAISLLLISCGNVAGLLLARGSDRQYEMAIRGALGAGRMRVAQAMLAESFLLVMTGAGVGLPLASLLNRIPMPAPMTYVQDAMALDSRVLPYSGLLIGFATLVCGVFPAIRTMRIDLIAVLNQGGRLFTAPRAWLRELLVAGQVAMTFILIVAALLCVRSQMLIAHADLGFDIDHGVVAQFGLQRNQYEGQDRVRLADRLTKRIEQIPSVVSVSVADIVPLSGNALIKSFHPAGRTDIAGTRPDTFSVGPGYFRTLGIPLLRGREFNAFDQLGVPSVVIVNETFARTYFSRTNIIEEIVQTAGERDSRVIGIVRDHRIGTIGESPRSVLYYSFAQRPTELNLHVRSAVPPDALVAGVQQAIREIDGTIPVTVRTLHNATTLELTMRRSGMVLMGALGAVGLILAAVGLYGVLAYVAASRTGDVAIRMALGASRDRIRWEMLRRALIVVLPSVALGVCLSLLVMPAFSTFLAGVNPLDPVAFGGATAIFLLTGVAAGYVPAQRSARQDPMQVFRRQ